ncbi:SIMPL domain-containing protein [Psychrobacter sp. I-STPA10]|uniref:SIMPL domain-containing protein n=1 Tax=Psychrobacter sp. I-STPA10 TaxID=2585769 RepID=UPI001E5AD1AB|nr:SIMPL domain-containing protein [Psychrobacter sp. I-STPA10]
MTTTNILQAAKNTNIGSKSLAALILMSSTTLLASQAAIAAPTGYNQITFSADVKAEVANDEVNASLSKKAQAKDPKTLANQINNAINKALIIAKRYPTVNVSTGEQRTYPQYDKNDKIIGWTGQSSIDLKSNDLEATSQLIAELQDSLVIDYLNFGVSDAKRDALEQQLMTQASKAFQAQANSLTKAWNASGYRVVAVSLNSGNHYYPQPVSLSAPMVAGGASAPKFESGNSTISVTANGTIELVQ